MLRIQDYHNRNVLHQRATIKQTECTISCQTLIPFPPNACIAGSISICLDNFVENCDPICIVFSLYTAAQPTVLGWNRRYWWRRSTRCKVCMHLDHRKRFLQKTASIHYDTITVQYDILAFLFFTQNVSVLFSFFITVVFLCDGKCKDLYNTYIFINTF